MADYRRSSPIFLLAASFFCAYFLMILPVPEFVRWLRPNLVVIVLLYWLVRSPESIGIGIAWLLGFLFDGISGSDLGQHALSFSIVAYLILAFHKHIHMFSLSQQIMLTFVLLLLEQIVVVWLDLVFHGGEYHPYLILSAVVGAGCWPVVSGWLNHSQRLFSVSR